MLLLLEGTNYLYLSRENTNFNPLVTSEISHPYHLDESIFIFKGLRCFFFSFHFFHFSMKIMSANRNAKRGVPSEAILFAYVS